MASGCFFFSVFIGALLHLAVDYIGGIAQVLSTLLSGVGRLRPSDEKNLVRRERPVGLSGGGNVDRVALGQGHLYRCSFGHRNSWGHGDCLRAVLIMNHQSGATASP